MLLDHITNDQRQPEEGVRVAGLLDLVNLAKLVGGAIDEPAVSAMRRSAMLEPLEAYATDRAFIDPVGRLMIDTGPTYEGRKLREYQSLDTLQRRGQKLADYLKGTQMGDMLAPHIPDIRVGITDTPGFQAGFAPPSGKLPGVLAIGADATKEDIPSLFEHEMQHAYQSMLGMPKGTTPDRMSDAMTEYLIEIGVMSPAKSHRIERAAAAQGIDRGTARYLSTIGEAEARAAQLRQDYVTSGIPYSSLGPPEVEQYKYNPHGFDMGKDFFAIPQWADDGFSQWWQRRQRGGRP